MDPDEALRQLRRLSHLVDNPDWDAEELTDAEVGDRWADLAMSLGQHWDALDDWLTKGGYLPEPWQAGRLLVPAPAYDDEPGVKRHAVYGVQKDGQALCVCGVMLPEDQIDQHVRNSNPKESV